MRGTPLSARAAAWMVAIATHMVPRGYRARWPEEWLGEIDAASPGIGLVARAAGVLPDALSCRRIARRAVESPAFDAKGSVGDLRYSARLIRHAPGFTVAAVLSLAVGITVTTTVFGAVNALLLRSLPGVHDSTRLAQVFTTTASHSHVAELSPQSSDEPLSSYEHYRLVLTAFSDLAAFSRAELAIAIRGEPVVGMVLLASPNYFAVLGTTAAAGRLLDASTAHEQVVVTAHDFAIRHFGSVAAAIGRTVQVGGRAMQIIGVAPRYFVGAKPGYVGDDAASRPQLWLPLSYQAILVPPPIALFNRPLLRHNHRRLHIVGRLDDGVSWREARAEANAVPPHTFEGSLRKDAKTVIVPIGLDPQDTPGDVAAVVALTLAIPLLVLAIGCANTANLYLARAFQRHSEIAVRRSLGASRGRIVRQLLTESVLIASLAGGISVVGTHVMTRLLAGFVPIPFPVDWRVLAFALAVALLTGIAFGMAPALTATRGDLTSPLKGSAGVPVHRRSKLRTTLVVAQVALSVLLLVMASLFSRTVQRMQSTGSEFELDRLAAVTLDLGVIKYSEVRGRKFQEALLARIERTPGVVAAAIVPFEPFSEPTYLIIRKPDDGPQPPHWHVRGGAPLGHFLETAGIRVTRGQGFTDADRRGTPKVALVSETLALRLSPSGNVIGQPLLVGDGEMPKLEVRIVGVTSDARWTAAGSDRQALFLPSPLNYDRAVSLWVRTAGDSSSVLPAIRKAVAELDPHLPVRRIGTAESWRDQEVGPVRWVATGLGLMGLLALILAGGGLYAVMSFLVAARRVEMAIRLALGARRWHLTRLVVADAMRLSIPGLFLGVLLAVSTASVVRGLLVGVSPLDPIAIASMSAVLLLVAIAATLFPAIRASQLDPLATLRRQ